MSALVQLSLSDKQLTMILDITAVVAHGTTAVLLTPSVLLSCALRKQKFTFGQTWNSPPPTTTTPLQLRSNYLGEQMENISHVGINMH